jgi:hypothetical protein
MSKVRAYSRLFGAMMLTVWLAIGPTEPLHADPPLQVITFCGSNMTRASLDQCAQLYGAKDCAEGCDITCLRDIGGIYYVDYLCDRYIDETGGCNGNPGFCGKMS